MRLSRPSSTRRGTNGSTKPNGEGGFTRLLVVFILFIPMLAGGCGHTSEAALSEEANRLFHQGDYPAALARYRQILERHPEVADRVLFEMGVTHAYPGNVHKDYRKALACFEKLVRDFPRSDYRHDSQMMILEIHSIITRDETIAAQKAALARLRQALEAKTEAVAELEATVAALEAKVFAVRMEPADKVLIEKQARRLTLFARGEAIKTYTIALGGNPVGPKVREGDNKTPEGRYIIDARNRNSGYHLSLHISYPNAEDKRRARALGVRPGGNIMIHGIKNGYAEVGEAHARTDWTEGCIAVTNPEMEEIFKLVPNGTLVEITP